MASTWGAAIKFIAVGIMIFMIFMGAVVLLQVLPQAAINPPAIPNIPNIYG